MSALGRMGRFSNRLFQYAFLQICAEQRLYMCSFTVNFRAPPPPPQRQRHEQIVFDGKIDETNSASEQAPAAIINGWKFTGRSTNFGAGHWRVRY